MDFATSFQALTGNEPFPWQARLFERLLGEDIPAACDIPTGLGKTSVIALWLLALARQAEAVGGAGVRLQRRLVYVVDRRAVVDQATSIAERLHRALKEAAQGSPAGQVRAALQRLCLNPADRASPLAISTLRGQHVDNRAWLDNPAAPAIVVGTVDMVGSRLLFSGYGVSAKMRPYHAGFLGADTLVVLDEAHLVPPFEALLEAIAGEANDFRPRDEALRDLVPRLRLMSLSATGQERAGNVLRLEGDDCHHTVVAERLWAEKPLRVNDVGEAKADKIIERFRDSAWTLATEPGFARVLVFCHSRELALRVKEAIDKQAKERKIAAPSQLLVGERRVHERAQLMGWLQDNGFIAGAGKPPEAPTLLIATAAGEVGVDLDADHMVCDLVEWERMVQRLGRVNRRGGEGRSATVEVIAAPPKDKRKDGETWEDRLARLRAPLDRLPPVGNSARNASPGAIATLRADRKVSETLKAAETLAPLRPDLTRALVDAWSMTSLDEHTGRPEIEPWLRGWVDEEEPQTTLVWRRWLPWRKNSPEPLDRDVEELFDSARVHLDETLEAPAWRVLDWLHARAAAQKAKPRGAAPRLADDSPALIVLDRKGKLERGRDLQELADLAQLKGKDRDRAEADLAGRTLVVASALGGLSPDGLLVDDWNDPAGALDHGWDEETLLDSIGYRVAGPGDPEPDTERWKLDTTVALAEPQDTDEEQASELRVYVARDRTGAYEGDPALARRCQRLDEHETMVEAAVRRIAEALGLPDSYRTILEWVARHHDLGKDRAEPCGCPLPALPTPRPFVAMGATSMATGTSSARLATCSATGRSRRSSTSARTCAISHCT